MPYCTIEEAWKTSLNPELENMEVSNADDTSQQLTKTVSFKNSELYDSEGNPITCKKSQKSNKNQRMSNFSRTYNRLPEHSGPKTRFNNDTQMVYVRSEDVCLCKN